MGTSVNLSTEDKIASLLELSYLMDIDTELMLTIYVLLGEDLFLLLHLLSGHRVKFVSTKTLQRVLSQQKPKLVELLQKSYKVSGVYKGSLTLIPGDKVVINSQTYEVVKSPVTILGHIYCYLKEL